MGDVRFFFLFFRGLGCRWGGWANWAQLIQVFAKSKQYEYVGGMIGVYHATGCLGTKSYFSIRPDG